MKITHYDLVQVNQILLFRPIVDIKARNLLICF